MGRRRGQGKGEVRADGLRRHWAARRREAGYGVTVIALPSRVSLPLAAAAAVWASHRPAAAEPPVIRVASFNVSLSPNSASSLPSVLANPASSAPRRVAEIIQRVAPDVILLNELNDDAAASGANLDAFAENFVAVSQGGQAAQSYPHRFTAPVNTGVHSGLDLNNSGSVNATPGTQVYADDCYGFGRFPGQYSMGVLSKFPLRTDGVRTLQNFLWPDMPGALLPDIPGTPAPGDYYNAAERAVFRLSSKSHWDVPFEVGGHVVHLLASHPTPPTFDGSEDRNGRRNHDEIRLWADYVDPARDAYIYDDEGSGRGLGADRRFVIVGDQNADPVDGDSSPGAARQLTGHPLIWGGFTPAASDGGTDTAGFAGGLRVDYALPSRAGFSVLGGGVFWPRGDEPGADLVSVSDHRLVWVDLRLEPVIAEAVRDLKVAAEGGDLVLSWGAQEGVLYEVQGSEDVGEGGWAALAGVEVEVGAGGASVRIAGAVTAGGRSFYRVGAVFD